MPNLTRDAWVMIMSHLDDLNDVCSVARVCRVTREASWLDVLWNQLAKRMLGAVEYSGREAFRLAWTLPQWRDGEGFAVERVSRTSARVQWEGRDAVVVANRPFHEGEVAYWEVLQTGERGLRLGLSDEGKCVMADLWVVGFAVCVGGGTYIKGRSLVPPTRWEQAFQVAPSVFSKSPHENGSYELGRGYANKLVGFLYDGKRASLDLFCNRVFVCTIFQDLPHQVWAAMSNGTGPTKVETRFWGSVIPQPLTGFDQYLLP